MAMFHRVGLTLAIVGLLTTVAVSFIPYIGVYICAPLIAASVGISTGYIVTRRETNQSKLDAGIIASVLAGGGTLLGSMIFMLLLILLIRVNPTVFNPIVLTYYAQTSQPMSPEQLQSIMMRYGPAAGLCFGVLNLMIATAFGLLGSWGATRTRRGSPTDASGSPS